MTAGTTVGSDARNDCRVTVARANSAAIEVETKAKDLVEPGIRTVVGRVLNRFGNPSLAVTVEDFGALDYVLEARIETAVREALSLEAMAPGKSPKRTVTIADRPRRSRLYAPGNTPRLLAGIEIHGADCVLLDLEDSVPVTEKSAARALVKHLLAAVAFPEDVWVRINSLDTGGEEDVREVLLGRPHGLCLPKAEAATDVKQLAALLDDVEDATGCEPGFTKIMPILETARGILHAEEIACSDPRVVILAFGAEDFTRDIGSLRSGRSLLFARSTIVAAAAAAGIQASDTVFADLSDEEGLAKECALARELGFDGKGAINPRQLAVIHDAFSPSEEELDYARRVVAAADEAEKSGSGAVALDGKMIDKPVVLRARRLIAYSERLSVKGEGA
jgi:citrate lyase subunit beta / citryl-CoA lyase